MNKTDRIIAVFICTMFKIINLYTIFIIKYMNGNIEITSMFFFINTILFLVPFKFADIYTSSPTLLNYS